MSAPKLMIKPAHLGLFTDLYELTMAQAYFEHDALSEATFSLVIRQNPANRGFMVCSGLSDVLEYLESPPFDNDDLGHLRSTGIFSDEFLKYLGSLSKFSGSIRAIPEGRIFFSNEPVLEITGPIVQVQLAETYIINQINFQTLLATKAARCYIAANGRGLADFASRRTHGTDAALKMARSSYIGGFLSTSNVLAGLHYGINLSGTMAHSFISSFASEIEAFRAYSKSFPHRTILLLDTYDTIKGAKHAVIIGKELEEAGYKLLGVRLDSGDFDSLSRQVRTILDDAGLSYVNIIASGGLDEFQIETLVKSNAPIDQFGVGTKVGVSADAPWSDMSYKLVEYDQRPVMKLSTDKISMPGKKQVFRFEQDKAMFKRDVIGSSNENLSGAQHLLDQILLDGTPLIDTPDLQTIRNHFLNDLSKLEQKYQGLCNPDQYPVCISPKLQKLTDQVHKKLIQTG